MCAKQETSAMTVGTIIALVSVYITAKDNYELFDDIVILLFDRNTQFLSKSATQKRCDFAIFEIENCKIASHTFSTRRRRYKKPFEAFY